MVFSVIPKTFKINGQWLYTPSKNRRGKIRKVGQTDRYRRYRFRITNWRWRGRSPRKAPGNLPLWFGPVLPLKIPLRVDKAYGRETRKEISSPTIGVTIACFCVLHLIQNFTVIIFVKSAVLYIVSIRSASAAVSWQPGRQPAVDKVKYTAGRAERSEPAYDLRGR